MSSDRCRPCRQNSTGMWMQLLCATLVVAAVGTAAAHGTAHVEQEATTITGITDAQRAQLAWLRERAATGDGSAYLGICRLLMELGLHAQAAATCEKAIELLQPPSAPETTDAPAATLASVSADLRDAYRIWGDALRETGRYTKAAQAYAIAFKAGDTTAAGGLVLALTWTGRFDGAARAIAAAAARLPPGEHVRIGSRAHVHANSEIVHTFSPWIALLLGYGPREALMCAQRVSAAAEAAALASARPLPPLPLPAIGSALTVAYVSADYNGFSPVGQDLKSALAMHTAARVRAVCVALVHEDGSPLRAAIRSACPRFVSVAGLSAVQAATRIRQEGAHVAVDLVAMKGYMGSMGASYLSHNFVDRIAVPPDLARAGFGEHVVVVPRSVYVCDLKQEFARLPDEALPRRARLEYGLPEHAFIFACFNRLFKLDADTWHTWMRLLMRVPDSVLWLLRFPRDAEPVLRARAEALGVPPDRLHFTELFPAQKHLHVKVRLGLADLFLDTPRFNAHGTAAEALWAGVPVLTLLGRTMPQARPVPAPRMGRVVVVVVVVVVIAPRRRRSRWLTRLRLGGGGVWRCRSEWRPASFTPRWRRITMTWPSCW